MEDNKKTIEVIERKENSVVLSEEKVYEADESLLKNRLMNIRARKDGLIRQNKEIQKQFSELTEEEQKLDEILKALVPIEEIGTL